MAMAITQTQVKQDESLEYCRADFSPLSFNITTFMAD